mmetsp:Transcript_38101/g.81184  ORF Transcript_38101/g.81184 Transcript_38101/m.81184 type:complete len:223 (-) Transcript_38101:242-910(-)
MPVHLGDAFIDFEADSTQGKLKWHEFIEGSWAILFSHPDDFTPVCTTELGSVQVLIPEFEKRGVKVAALSCNICDSHKAWIADIIAANKLSVDELAYPIIADPQREVAHALGMLDDSVKDDKGMPMTCRAVFIIGPDKKLKLSLLYPASTGRNFGEIIRVLDSLQMTAGLSVATPANWKSGDACMVLPTLSTAEAKEKFTKGVDVMPVPSGKEYMRFTPDPR